MDKIVDSIRSYYDEKCINFRLKKQGFSLLLILAINLCLAFSSLLITDGGQYSLLGLIVFGGNIEDGPLDPLLVTIFSESGSFVLISFVSISALCLSLFHPKTLFQYTNMTLMNMWKEVAYFIMLTRWLTLLIFVYKHLIPNSSSSCSVLHDSDETMMGADIVVLYLRMAQLPLWTIFLFPFPASVMYAVIELLAVLLRTLLCHDTTRQLLTTLVFALSMVVFSCISSCVITELFNSSCHLKGELDSLIREAELDIGVVDSIERPLQHCAPMVEKVLVAYSIEGQEGQTKVGAAHEHKQSTKSFTKGQDKDNLVSPLHNELDRHLPYAWKRKILHLRLLNDDMRYFLNLYAGTSPEQMPSGSDSSYNTSSQLSILNFQELFDNIVKEYTGDNLWSRPPTNKNISTTRIGAEPPVSLSRNSTSPMNEKKQDDSDIPKKESKQLVPPSIDMLEHCIDVATELDIPATSPSIDVNVLSAAGGTSVSSYLLDAAMTKSIVHNAMFYVSECLSVYQLLQQQSGSDKGTPPGECVWKPRLYVTVAPSEAIDDTVIINEGIEARCNDMEVNASIFKAFPSSICISVKLNAPLLSAPQGGTGIDSGVSPQGGTGIDSGVSTVPHRHQLLWLTCEQMTRQIGGRVVTHEKEHLQGCDDKESNDGISSKISITIPCMRRVLKDCNDSTRRFAVELDAYIRSRHVHQDATSASSKQPQINTSQYPPLSERMGVFVAGESGSNLKHRGRNDQKEEDDGGSEGDVLSPSSVINRVVQALLVVDDTLPPSLVSWIVRKFDGCHISLRMHRLYASDLLEYISNQDFLFVLCCTQEHVVRLYYKGYKENIVYIATDTTHCSKRITKLCTKKLAADCSQQDIGILKYKLLGNKHNRELSISQGEVGGENLKNLYGLRVDLDDCLNALMGWLGYIEQHTHFRKVFNWVQSCFYVVYKGVNVEYIIKRYKVVGYYCSVPIFDNEIENRYYEWILLAPVPIPCFDGSWLPQYCCSGGQSKVPLSVLKWIPIVPLVMVIGMTASTSLSCAFHTFRFFERVTMLLLYCYLPFISNTVKKYFSISLRSFWGYVYLIELITLCVMLMGVIFDSCGVQWFFHKACVESGDECKYNCSSNSFIWSFVNYMGSSYLSKEHNGTVVVAKSIFSVASAYMDIMVTSLIHCGMLFPWPLPLISFILFSTLTILLGVSSISHSNTLVPYTTHNQVLFICGLMTLGLYFIIAQSFEKLLRTRFPLELEFTQRKELVKSMGKMYSNELLPIIDFLVSTKNGLMQLALNLTVQKKLVPNRSLNETALSMQMGLLLLGFLQAGLNRDLLNFRDTSIDKNKQTKGNIKTNRPFQPDQDQMRGDSTAANVTSDTPLPHHSAIADDCIAYREINSVRLENEIFRVGCLFDHINGASIEVYFHIDSNLSMIKTDVKILRTILFAALLVAQQNISKSLVKFGDIEATGSGDAKSDGVDSIHEIIIRVYHSAGGMAGENSYRSSTNHCGYRDKKQLMIQVIDTGKKVFHQVLATHSKNAGISNIDNSLLSHNSCSQNGINQYNTNDKAYSGPTRASQFSSRCDMCAAEEMCRKWLYCLGESYELTNMVHYRYNNVQLFTLSYYMHPQAIFLLKVLSATRVSSFMRAKRKDTKHYIVKGSDKNERSQYNNEPFLRREMMIVVKEDCTIREGIAINPGANTGVGRNTNSSTSFSPPRGRGNTPSYIPIKSSVCRDAGWECTVIDINQLNGFCGLDTCTVVLIDGAVFQNTSSVTSIPASIINPLRISGFNFAIVCMLQPGQVNTLDCTDFDGFIQHPLENSMNELLRIATNKFIRHVLWIEEGTKQEARS